MNRDEIDKLLEEAWFAEQNGEIKKAVDIYQDAINQIIIFRDKSPEIDHNVLNGLFLIIVIKIKLLKILLTK
jgi:hypothetical protein